MSDYPFECQKFPRRSMARNAVDDWDERKCGDKIIKFMGLIVEEAMRADNIDPATAMPKEEK